MFQKRIRGISDFISKQPIWVWVLLGASFSFFAFFIYPVFLNPQHVMQVFGYIPIKDPIGHDLALTTSFSETWFVKHETPYNGLNLYPPLSMLVYAPLVGLSPSLVYKLFTLLNLVAYVVLCAWLPWRIHKGKDISTLLVFFLVGGLFSYGFQFELERGQYNSLTFLICLFSVYLFHYHPRWRWLAYVLFTVSIHFKLFPAIFVLMFVDDWKDWKGIFKRMGLLLGLNLAALFVLGPQMVWDFINGVLTLGAQSDIFIWVGNHSIRSFSEAALPQILEAYHQPAPSALTLSIVQWVLLGFVLSCLLLVVVIAYRRNRPGLNPYLLMVCTLGALLIPSFSHDYTLAFLPAAMCILLPALDSNGLKRGADLLLVVILSAAYGATLFSFTNKPILWQNDLPVLMIMLLSCTLLYGLAQENPNREGYAGLSA
ncbi:MAG: DUF2029 domain-containing protein [Anaerolineae bacterium]|nr:DUF2029 domain-containing protein [Anaerolineae bacterium]